MKTRKDTSTGDYGFGRSLMLQDTPEAVAQVIRSRLQLVAGEWFLDTSEGTRYRELILGKGTAGTYDPELKNRILGTPGVSSLDAYSSNLTQDRVLTVTCTVTTLYGTASLTVGL